MTIGQAYGFFTSHIDDSLVKIFLSNIAEGHVPSQEMFTAHRYFISAWIHLQTIDDAIHGLEDSKLVALAERAKKTGKRFFIGAESGYYPNRKTAVSLDKLIKEFHRLNPPQAQQPPRHAIYYKSGVSYRHLKG